MELQDSIERQRQETLLRLAVQSFYSGEYAESTAQLKGYLEEKPALPLHRLPTSTWALLWPPRH